MMNQWKDICFESMVVSSISTFTHNQIHAIGSVSLCALLDLKCTGANFENNFFYFSDNSDFRKKRRINYRLLASLSR